MNSITNKFLLPAAGLVILLMCFTLYRTNQTSTAHVQQLMGQQASLALEFDLAIRKYVADHIRPQMQLAIGEDGPFIPETMSSSFVARSVFERVRETFPDYIIKFSSDDPRNPANLATSDELKMIEYFNANPNLDRWSGEINLDSKKYLAYFSARRMKESCLECHGDPADAPTSLIERYGSTTGFRRPIGQVIALDTVAVPIDAMQAQLANTNIQGFVWTFVALIVLFIAIGIVFRVTVSGRIADMAEHFKTIANQTDSSAISLIAVQGNDELSELAVSFNTLAEKLQGAHRTLERRVEERTAELEAANERLKAEAAEREKSEQALRESENEFRNVIQCAPMGALLYELREDGKLVLIDANPAASKHVGIDVQLLIGKTLEEAFPALVETDIPARFKAAAEHGERWHSPELHYKDGVISGAYDSYAFQTSPGRMATMFVDITDRKRTELELHQARDAAEAANTAKSDFLANMSHEIRTPMTAILGFADLLVEHSESNHAAPEQIDAARTIRRNGDYLLGIINDILDLSKIEAGHMNVEIRQTSPQHVVAEVESLVRVRADTKGLKFQVFYEGAIPETIETDSMRLRQILINLTGNAIKFTEVGGVQLIVQLINQDTTPQLAFDVVDSGLGMTEEQVGKLFQPFMQADTSTTRKFGGTGLGLTISKRFAEILGGDVRVIETQPGMGTRFRVSVATGPLDNVTMLDDVKATAIAGRPTLRLEPTKPTFPLRGSRILLAEDGPDNQRLISHILKKAGSDVTVVDHGQAAAETAISACEQNQPFDVILMDMQMPIMDGYEATRTLRTNGYTGTIIALTAHAMEGDREKCIDAGCDDYLNKPVDRTRMIELIESYYHAVVTA